VTAETTSAASSAARTDGLTGDAVVGGVISAIKICRAALGQRSGLTGH
jgi:hypothetical protein